LRDNFVNVLVTAGNTQVPIDRVRCITNLFTGRTGAQIALHAHERGHSVTLLTSHPEIVTELRPGRPPRERWAILPYRTFDDLQRLMAEIIQPGEVDVVVHSAAVSDYLAGGIYAPTPATHFRVESARWENDLAEPPQLVDMSAGKVKSDAPELWLRLVRAPKLIDRVRADWGFRGILVKFKLEVDVTLERLLEIAEQSRRHSAADLMVANPLEGARVFGYIGPIAGEYQSFLRAEIPARLFDEVERLHQEHGHG
jgi:phosphopantothenoylcysteine synthetase/decarboxylase